MLGGALGTLLRYLITRAHSLPRPTILPWSTIAINIAGSFIIGFFGTLTLSSGKFPVSENLRLLVMVGICGGFTTFSSFSLQTFDLMRSGYIVRATLNIVGSVVLCVCAVALGHLIAAHFNNQATAISQLSIEEESSFLNRQHRDS